MTASYQCKYLLLLAEQDIVRQVRVVGKVESFAQQVLLELGVHAVWLLRQVDLVDTDKDAPMFLMCNSYRVFRAWPAYAARRDTTVSA